MPGPDKIKKHWWMVKDDCQPYVVETWKKIEQSQATRRQKRATWLSLYEGRNIASLDGAQWAKWQDSDVLNLNVVQSVIDAVTAKISTNRPRPIFLTQGGNYDAQQRARGLTHLVEGVYHDQRVYAKSREVFCDACIWENGVLKVWPDHSEGRVKIERVLVDDLGVDAIDGLYGSPRSLIQHLVVSRSVAAETYGVSYEELEGAELLRKPELVDECIDEPISLLEAWHLPSASGAKDGRRVVCTSEHKLVDEPWEFDRFPFAVFRWLPRKLGWHGFSLAEQLHTIQKEITFVARKIQRMVNLATIRIGIQKNSKINIADLTNEEFAVLEYEGEPPLLFGDIAVPPQLFDWIWSLYSKAYELAGISQLFASSLKPPGLNSGVAQREYKDTESQRFMAVGQAWEEFHCHEVADLVVESARQLAEQNDGKYSIMAAEDRKLRKIEWSKIKLDRQHYRISVWPTSLLPRSPAGRLQTVKDLLDMFPQLAQSAADLLDFPDVDAAISLVTAPVRAIDMQIEQILDGETDVRPQPFTNLHLAGQRVLAAYLRAIQDGAPAEVQAEFHDYLLETQDMIEAANQSSPVSDVAVMPAPAGGVMQPGAAPAGPPLPQAGPGGGM